MTDVIVMYAACNGTFELLKSGKPVVSCSVSTRGGWDKGLHLKAKSGPVAA